MDFDTIYLNPTSVGSFGGVQRLRNEVGADADEWLEGLNPYTLYKPVQRKFKKLKYIMKEIDSLCQADLADYKAISKWNSGNNYVFIVIDVFRNIYGPSL